MNPAASLLYILIVWGLLIGQSEEACDAECITCFQDKTCSVCKVGFYVDGNYTLCSPCQQEGCTCTATRSCTGCIPGAYISFSSTTNSQTCISCSNNCNRCTSSRCDTCAEGYILEWRDSNNVCKQCPSNCFVCTQPTTCYTCMPGYYRYWSGSTYLCAQCQPECTDCRHNGCYQCKEGSYLDTHCYNCTEGCNNCSSDTYCNTCQDGYYRSGSTSGAILCQPCMDNCNICGTANTCTECYLGYRFKENVCQQDCPVNCKNNSCSMDKERCTAGCKDRYYGLICDQNCSTNCISCDQNSGRCTVCETGFYGDVCSDTCSSGCKTTNGTVVCNIEDGSCTDGCQLSTKYGPECLKDCSVYCVNQECDRVTARCLKGCQPGYHGENCTFPCNEGCINGSCHGSNGSCTSSCKEGFTGGQCIAGPASSGEQPISGGVIGWAVGGVVTGLIVIAAVVVGMCFIRHRRRSRKAVAGEAAFENADGPSHEIQASQNTKRHVGIENQAKYENVVIEPVRGGARDEDTGAAENVYDELMEDGDTAETSYSTLSPEVEYEDVLGQHVASSRVEDVVALEHELKELTELKESAERELLRRKLIARIEKTKEELKITSFELNQYPIHKK